MAAPSCRESPPDPAGAGCQVRDARSVAFSVPLPSGSSMPMLVGVVAESPIEGDTLVPSEALKWRRS